MDKLDRKLEKEGFKKSSESMDSVSYSQLLSIGDYSRVVTIKRCYPGYNRVNSYLVGIPCEYGRKCAVGLTDYELRLFIKKSRQMAVIWRIRDFKAAVGKHIDETLKRLKSRIRGLRKDVSEDD